MPALSGQFSLGISPLINIGVLPAGLLTPTTAQTVQVTAFPALLDTGASMTCVSPNVAQTVGLQPIGMRQIVSATHTVPVPVYLVDLVLLSRSSASVWHSRLYALGSPSNGIFPNGR